MICVLCSRPKGLNTRLTANKSEFSHPSGSGVTSHHHINAACGLFHIRSRWLKHNEIAIETLHITHWSVYCVNSHSTNQLYLAWLRRLIDTDIHKWFEMVRQNEVYSINSCARVRNKQTHQQAITIAHDSIYEEKVQQCTCKQSASCELHFLFSLASRAGAYRNSLWIKKKVDVHEHEKSIEWHVIDIVTFIQLEHTVEEWKKTATKKQRKNSWSINKTR